MADKGLDVGAGCSHGRCNTHRKGFIVVSQNTQSSQVYLYRASHTGTVCVQWPLQAQVQPHTDTQEITQKVGERYGRACHGCGTVAKLSAGWVAPGDVGSRRGTRSTGLFVKCGNYSCPRIRATTAPILPFTDEEAGRGGRVPLLHWEKVSAIHHSIFLIA